MKLKKSQLLSLFTLALSAPVLYAQTVYWDGADSATWATTANWSTAAGATTPNPAAAPGAANDVVFHISTVNATRTMTFGNGYNPAAKSITFRSTGTFTLNGNVSAAAGNRTLTIGSGGISKTSNSGVVNINGNTASGAAGTGVITMTLASATSQTWTNDNSATALNLGTTLLGTNGSAVISLGAFAGVNANTLTFAGEGNFNVGVATAANSAISGSTGSLIKNGAGALTINSGTTYGGATTISGGKLALAGSGPLANTPTIIVGASTTFDVSGLTASSYTLGSSQTVGGSGTILATGKTVVANGTLSPGSSPGTLTQDGGSLQLGVGGDYNWQIHDADGAAGTGYDTTSLINGATLDLSLLSAGNTYNINLWSLSGIGPDVSGNAIDFNNTLAYSWTLFSTGTAITGFSTDKFTINTGAFNGTTGFSNALGGGTFSVGLSGDNTDLVLKFTSVPEPNAALLGSLSIIALLRRRR
jgi:autotransporter-associated beta strand protein